METDKIEIEEIINDVKSGLSASQIAWKYDLSEQGVRIKVKRYLEQNKMKMEEILPENAKNIWKRKVIELPMEEIMEKWRKGQSLSSLAREYGVPGSTLVDRKTKYERENGKVEREKKKTIIKEKKILKIKTEKPKIKTKKNTVKKQTEVNIKQIWRERKNGVPLHELASKHNISYRELYEKLNQYYSELLAEAYVNSNKSIGNIALTSGLEILEVKERIRNVLRKQVKTVPVIWYLQQKNNGYTEEQILRMYIKQEKQKNKVTREPEEER